MVGFHRLQKWAALLGAPLLVALGWGPLFAPCAVASDRIGPYSVEVTDAAGRPLRTFGRDGRTWVLGEESQRYRIRVRNRSPETVEAVISVDGRDALDGLGARASKPGYLVQPWGEVVVDGFRLSLRDVATFRFSAVVDSYAAQMGDDRQVGVIGVAIFRQRPPPPPRPMRWRQPCEEGGAAESGDAGRGQPSPPSRDANASGAASGLAAKASPAARGPDRAGLGTAFGERRSSQVVQSQFERANPARPDALLAVHYNDRDGLLALGIDLRPPRPRPDAWELQRRALAQPFADVPLHFAAPPPGWGGR